MCKEIFTKYSQVLWCLKSNLYLYPVLLIVLKVKTWWKKKERNEIKNRWRSKFIDARNTDTRVRAEFSVDEHGNRDRNCFFGRATIESPWISDGTRDVAWPDLIVFKELDSFNSSNYTKYPLQTITIQRLNFYTRIFCDTV